MRIEMAAENTTQTQATSHVVNLLVKRHDEIINLWIKDRLESGEFRDELIPKKESRRQSQQIIDMRARSLKDSDGADFDSASFDEMRSFLNEISHARAVKGSPPLDTPP